MSINDPKGRRNFFKRGFNKAANVGMDVIERKVQRKALHWIRPPFSIPELDFLLSCNRCNACIDACPHKVIFSLPARLGIEVVGTPALDIVNKGCHLCADWPCVTSCETKALSFNFSLDDSEIKEEGDTADQKALLPDANDCPPMASAQINHNSCLPWQGPECGACKGSCPVPDALSWQSERPKILTEECVGCGLCREACIATPSAIEISALIPIEEGEEIE